MSATSNHHLEEASSSYDGPILHSHLAHNTFKKARLQSTFDLIAQMLIVVFVGLLVYYNGLMLLPHVTPIFWALLWAIFLHRPLVLIKRGLEWVDLRTNDLKMKVYLTTATLYILITLTSSLLTIVIATLIFSVWSFLIFGDRSSVAALLLLAIMSAILALPTYWIIMTCVEESQAIATKIQTFVRENPQFTNLLNDFGNSPYYRWVHSYAAQWGVEVPPFDAVQIKEKIVEFSLQFTSHFTDALGSIVYFLSDGLRLFVSFITFASTLFYLLVNMTELNQGLSDISPFSDEDSHLLMKSLNKSVTSVFVSSFAVGVAHLIGTYIVFKLCGVDLALVLSFIAGFTSVLPVIGSWIVWVPIAVGKLLIGETLHCVAIVTVQILLQGPVDTLIYSFIPGNTFLVGFALAMGIWVFGPIGVVVGPLLAGLTVTVGDIYRTYQRLPRLKLRKGLSANELPVDLDQLDQAAMSVGTPSLSKHSSSGASSSSPHMPMLVYPNRHSSPATTTVSSSNNDSRTVTAPPPQQQRPASSLSTPLVVPPKSRRETQPAVPVESLKAITLSTSQGSAASDHQHVQPSPVIIATPLSTSRSYTHKPPEIAPLPPASPIRLPPEDQGRERRRSVSVSRNMTSEDLGDFESEYSRNSRHSASVAGDGDNNNNDEDEDIETILVPQTPLPTTTRPRASSQSRNDSSTRDSSSNAA